ncbi:MAG: 50S ribosomal protein L4 [Clostridia bacterium]|nr:50S ribosomal protein L4 [Clostridia bacterium]MBQ6614647.1 50S ribosomal protein L4 [Clostridia bacterium]MEE1277542.1 50S ribosomal protein L4 [Acutalibacteraceae bacterium]
MPRLAVVDMAGNSVDKITLNKAVFGIEPNVVVMHMAVVNYLANKRQGTQSTLTRTEVSGGGKKPWRQKGTGHARQGSTRAPQWRHGGIVHAPKPRDYSFSLNKKVRALAIKSALSDKVQNKALIVLDKFELESYKTRAVVDCLKAIGAGKKTLLVLADNNPVSVKSCANIPGLKTAQYNTINTYDIVNADSLVIVKDAVAKIEEVYA